MWRRIVGWTLLAVMGAGGMGLAYMALRRPAAAKPTPVKIEITPARLARGEYIFRLADCDGCHSQRDFGRFGGPVVAGGRGKGGAIPEARLPGRVVARNITPDLDTGIGAWADGEKIRAIREGISRDGSALFPMMPYRNFRHMSDEDVYALVAYLNTVPPVKNPVPRTKLDFPVSLMMKSAPQPAGSVPPPDLSTKVKRGEYLVTLAGCADCHTQEARGQLIESRRLAGGRAFRIGPAMVVTANLTPDPETGLGQWKEEHFLRKFYQYRKYVEKGSPEITAKDFTLMPWLDFYQLPPEDLGAIYAYLRTVRPIYNAVVKHPEPEVKPEPTITRLLGDALGRRAKRS